MLYPLPSLSHPKTPYPYPSIAVPVLDMTESSGVKSSAENEAEGGRSFGSSCSGIVAFLAMLWGYDVVVVELGVFLRTWIGLGIAVPADWGSGWLMLEMGGCL